MTKLPAAPEPLSSPVFDSHCHLDIMVGNRQASSGDPVAQAAQAASASVRSILDDARAVGVTRLVTIGYDLASSRWNAEVAAAQEGVYAGVAIHPNEAHEATPEVLAEIEALAGRPEVRAVGRRGSTTTATGRARTTSTPASGRTSRSPSAPARRWSSTTARRTTTC